MKVKELINYLNELTKDDEDYMIAIDLNINGQLLSRSSINKLNLYGKDELHSSNLITLETEVNVLGAVDTVNLINNRIKEMVETADEKVE